MLNPPRWAPLSRRSVRASSVRKRKPASAVSSSAEPYAKRQQHKTSTSRDDIGEAPGEAETVVASASAGVPTKESAQSTELSRERSTTTRTVEDEGRRNSLSSSPGGQDLSAAKEKASIGVQALLIDDGEQTVQPLHVGKAE